MAQWPAAELAPPGPRAARATAILWWLLFALAVVAVIDGLWLRFDSFRHPSGFDRVGLQVTAIDPCVTVTASSHSASAAWPDGVDSFGACVVGVDGAAVDRSASKEAIGALLDGPAGSRVSVALAASDGQGEAQFVRARVGGWFQVCVMILDALAAALYPAVALLLWRRRSLDPVSRHISFAFLLVMHLGLGPRLFWGEPALAYMVACVGLLIATVILPAYPDGVYVPRAARWLRILPFACVGAIAIDLYATGGMATGVFLIAIGALLPVGLLLLVVRYARMPAGLEKQQVKWAVFGMSVGVVLMVVAFVVAKAVEQSAGSPEAFSVRAGLADLFGILGFAAIPAGFAISLLEYRLNDADAAVGKSIGYAIVTLIVAVVWALLQSVVGDLFKQWLNGPMVTALTTVTAALVFTPTRSYVLAWTESKFQPALVHLRKLPEKLDRWQTCQTPDELAQAALADLVNGIGAAYAVVLGDDGREWRVLAANGIEPQAAMAQLAAERPADRSQDPFPIRRELTDQLGQPDLLAIGPRSDGASFTGDEKAAIALIIDPLSNAIQAAALRERHILKVESSLAGIDQRLARLEDDLTPVAREPRRGRKQN